MPVCLCGVIFCQASLFSWIVTDIFERLRPQAASLSTTKACSRRSVCLSVDLPWPVLHTVISSFLGECGSSNGLAPVLTTRYTGSVTQ